jgi:hypothetical protein
MEEGIVMLPKPKNIMQSSSISIISIETIFSEVFSLTVLRLITLYLSTQKYIVSHGENDTDWKYIDEKERKPHRLHNIGITLCLVVLCVFHELIRFCLSDNTKFSLVEFSTAFEELQ